MAPETTPTFSFSRVKTFRQCPARYRYRYLDRLEERFTSVEAHLGTCVHEVLEWLYSERDHGREPGAAEVVQRLTAVWSEQWKPNVAVVRRDSHAETYLEAGIGMVERFVRAVLPRDRSETIGLEQRLSRSVPGDVRFVGFADRVGRTESGRLFVVDYKTSSNGGAYPEPEDGLQVKLYAAALIDQHDADDVLGGFHYLSTGRTRWISVERRKSSDLWRRFGELVRDVKVAREFPPQPGPLCPWCGFCGECPAAKVPPNLAGGLELTKGLG